jgi:predicted RNase H-like nuclease
MTAIGVDCASDPKNVGLALGRFVDGHIAVEAVRRGAREPSPVEVVARWIETRGAPVLLALDAPLGWPVPLADTLVAHRAGDPLDAEAHALFRRATDRFVRDRLGKQPLDVGADRIARTAHAALAFLSTLRQRLGLPIPLAWQPEVAGMAAIEVYPAATLAAHGLLAPGYKHPQGHDVRRRLAAELGERLALPHNDALFHSDHLLDAALCVLAAQDFLRGEAMPPLDRGLAEREGWIWVRQP